MHVSTTPVIPGARTSVRPHLRRCLADAHNVILGLFARPAVDRQPRFIADTGLGNPEWLADLYGAIRDTTARGENLGDHPLVVISIRSGPAELDQAAHVFAERGVPALLLTADTSAPAAIAAELRRHGHEMNEGLHLCSVAGRGSGPPHTESEPEAESEPESGGDAAEDALIGWLRRWAPFVRRHGLLALAEHDTQTQPGGLPNPDTGPDRVRSPHQPIAHSRWLHCCRKAGLEWLPYEARRYPSSGPAVAVSLNRLVPVAGRQIAEPRSGVASGAAAPERVAATEDGQSLHELLFDAGDIRRPRPWCADPAGWIVARALDAIERRLNATTGGETIRVLDYGAGTGFGAIEVLKAISERGITGRLAAADVSLELHLVDLPTEWFAQSVRLLGAHPWVHFHDLRSGGGGFRALPEVMNGRPVDVIIANMVFHLIPAKAMTRVAESMAAVLRLDGCLLWNSPDVGPAGRAAVLFHDANRAVRKEWLSESVGQSLPRDVYSAVRHAHTALTAEAQERANRRILPQPNDVDDIAAALGTHLAGSTCRADFEILSDELLDTLLVPSNAAEYFPELADHSAREAVIRALMAKVMGTLGHGPAATAGGLNVSWTFGQFGRRPTAR